MNNLCILILILLIAVPILYSMKKCGYKQEDFGSYKEGGYQKLQDDAGRYTFIPYRMNFTRDVSHRGCETSKYWDCVNNHPLTKGDHLVKDIAEKVDNECKQYSNDQCYFPARISHSRTEPYHQYLDYI